MFNAPQSYPAPNPGAIAAAAFNGDGKIDLAVTMRQIISALLFLDDTATGEAEDEEQKMVELLCRLSPEIAHAQELALNFVSIVRERRVDELREWLIKASCKRDSFCAGLLTIGAEVHFPCKA